MIHNIRINKLKTNLQEAKSEIKFKEKIIKRLNQIDNSDMDVKSKVELCNSKEIIFNEDMRMKIYLSLYCGVATNKIVVFDKNIL